MFVKPHKMCLVPDFFLLPLTHLKFSIHSHYSQEKPIAGQPEYQGLYSSLFGVVIIRSVEIFIDASKLVKNVFPISDYNCKVFKFSKMFLPTIYVKPHSGFYSVSSIIMWDTFVLAIVLRSIDVIESILTVAVTT